MRTVGLKAVRALGGGIIEEKLVDTALASRSGTLRGCLSRGTGVDERGSISALIDLLKVDHELGRIVLGVCEYFGAVKGNDMIRDDLHSLGGEVSVVDAKVTVEPVDLVGYEFTGDEALNKVVRRSVMVL